MVLATFIQISDLHVGTVTEPAGAYPASQESRNGPASVDSLVRH